MIEWGKSMLEYLLWTKFLDLSIEQLKILQKIESTKNSPTH